MKKKIVSILCGLTVLGFTALAQQQISLKKEISKPEVLQVDPVAVFKSNVEILRTGVASHHMPLAIQGKTDELILERVDLFAPGFQFVDEKKQVIPVDLGVHYRGSLKNDPEAVATMSVYKDNYSLTIEDGEHVQVLEKKNLDKQTKLQFEQFEKVNMDELSKCETKDVGKNYTLEQLTGQFATSKAPKTVNVYLEVDYPIYNTKFSRNLTNTSNWVTTVFNKVVSYYAANGITVKLSSSKIWTVASSYSGSLTGNWLTSFTSKLPSTYNGDIAQLWYIGSSGGVSNGIAILGKPKKERASVLGINKTSGTLISNANTYTAVVAAHELGHGLGSFHTHACKWNGNNTALDGCPGRVEGTCAIPAIPTTKGCIMSYCGRTRAGIGTKFWNQPANAIKSHIEATLGTAAIVDQGNTYSSTGLVVAFPNPASDVVNFQAGNDPVVGVSVFNTSGQLILSALQGQVNMNQQAPGVYYAVVKLDSGNTERIRFIKQ